MPLWENIKKFVTPCQTIDFHGIETAYKYLHIEFGKCDLLTYGISDSKKLIIL